MILMMTILLATVAVTMVTTMIIIIINLPLRCLRMRSSSPSGQVSARKDIAQLLFGGRLIAMDKKSDRIRPIVVGYLWRHLAAKCTSAHATNTLVDYFSPLQLRVGVIAGCEANDAVKRLAAICAARRFISKIPLDNIFVKLDFSNAFNCRHRDFMFERVGEVLCALYKFCYLVNSRHSTLQFGKFSISSEDGPPKAVIQLKGSFNWLYINPTVYCLLPYEITIGLWSKYHWGTFVHRFLGRISLS